MHDDDDDDDIFFFYGMNRQCKDIRINSGQGVVSKNWKIGCVPTSL
jgi:5-keto 4-deoxyuronate isomerase